MSEFTATLQAALAPSYTLERELTGGGMSRVFVATDTALGRKVVVKVLPPELAAGVNHERFRREIQVAAQLQHPHIVPLLSAGEKGTLIWYTMPYIDGHSLRDAIARGEKFSVRDVIRLMREVAEGLGYAHSLGVIHRDIKPGNVLILARHAMVTDFGVSKAISAAMPHSGYTSAGTAIGTPAYMAPEQIAADPAADHRMDLYALGLLGYELLAGKVPFKEASPQQTMAAQLTRDPEPIERIRSDVPPQLAALLRTLLAKVPDDRPATAAAVVAELDAIPTGSGETMAFPAVRRPSRGRVLMTAVVGLTVVAAAWMMGERRGVTAGSAQMRDSLAVADSLQAVAPAAALLTREDSMAIASAVASRMAERPAPTRRGTAVDSTAWLAMADSIRSQVQRVVLDSLLRVQSRVAMVSPAGEPAPNVQVIVAEAEQLAREAVSLVAGAPTRRTRRVVVAPPRPSRSRGELDAAARLITDSLRRALDGHPRYEAVPLDSVTAVLAQTRTVNAVQERLDADVIISLALIPRGDSLVRLLQVRDLAAPDGFSLRVVSTTVASTAPTSELNAVVANTFRALIQMERGAMEFRRMERSVGETPRTPEAPPLRRP